MIWNEYPEVKLARRILDRHKLTPPFKVRHLLELHATVLTEAIPIDGVDGIAINIKVLGKTPTVIVNQNSSETRQTFTMAHELGHLVIPWHIGIRIDEDKYEFESGESYSLFEMEANRFAAELLMPSSIIRQIAANNTDMAKAHKETCRRLRVSPQAAALQVGNTFPPGAIYCAVEDGTVVYSGCTAGTSESKPFRNEIFNEDWYPRARKHSSWNINGLSIHWWEMTDDMTSTTAKSKRDWRKILDDIVSSIDIKEEKDRYKLSVNAIIAHANGRKRIEGNHTFPHLLEACHQRFNVERHALLRNHPDFDEFLNLRLIELLPVYEIYQNKSE
ncbi:ImmA/IrrE family metallo-endopeptidase [Spirosoma luteum]|uniref:ImmA/IrrE family metallo-endopeptidase n=1 Tax=Spirosoma luteum TaxID=431553 RepID=UPI00035EC135|nr:ImmA/IrrE family metallo-endopeptidase [Spirosoma luteum]